MSQNTYNVLFLDIDGVLNNMEWAMEMSETQGVDIFAKNMFNPDALMLLKEIIDRTNARIVISSSWRKIPSLMNAIHNQLNSIGLSVYDVTPYTGGTRGDDIAQWLMNHISEVTNYAILDDDSDMGAFIHHLSQTTFQKGLTRSEADFCIDIIENTIHTENGTLTRNFKNEIHTVPCKIHPDIQEVYDIKDTISSENMPETEFVTFNNKTFPVIRAGIQFKKPENPNIFWYRTEDYDF